MLEMILDKHVVQVVIGMGVAVGVISKCIVNVSLKRLVRGAGSMGKSNHPFMRLVRAKFEHACMVSEKVENVEAFVDKYLYEYRVAGLKLHSLQRMEVTAVLICAAMGVMGGFLEYTVNGMNDAVLTIGATGLGAGILLYLFHLTTDEKYRMEAVRNYMVDYLENVCLHRYEKAYQKETQKEAQPEVKQESQKEAQLDVQPEAHLEAQLEEQPEVQLEPQREVLPMPEREPIPRILPVSDIRMSKVEPKEDKDEVEEKKETPAKEVLIRQILEEFMA